MEGPPLWVPVICNRPGATCHRNAGHAGSECHCGTTVAWYARRPSQGQLLGITARPGLFLPCTADRDLQPPLTNYPCASMLAAAPAPAMGPAVEQAEEALQHACEAERFLQRPARLTFLPLNSKRETMSESAPFTAASSACSSSLLITALSSVRRKYTNG
jgi:hypothetical protein